MTGENPYKKAPLSVRIAYAVEDWVNRHTYEPSPAPQGPRFNRRAAIWTGALAAPATFLLLWAASNRQRQLPKTSGSGVLPAAQEATFPKDRSVLTPGQYTEKPVENQFYFQETSGFTVRFEETNIKRIFGDTRLGLKPPHSIYTAVIFSPLSGNSQTNTALVESKVGPVIMMSQTTKKDFSHESLFLDVPKAIAEVIQESPDNSKIITELNRKLILRWARWMRELNIQYGTNQGLGANLNEEATNIVLGNPPFYITKLDPSLVMRGAEHVVFAGQENKQPPFIVIEGGHALNEETIFYNATPGLDIGVDINLWRILNKHPELNVNVPHSIKLIVVAAPVDDDPAQIEAARSIFERDKAYPLVNQLFPGQNITPHISIIPMLKLVRNAYGSRQPSDAKEKVDFRKGFLSIDLSEGFFLARRKVLTDDGRKAAIGRDHKPFIVTSIDPKLIERALR